MYNVVWVQYNPTIEKKNGNQKKLKKWVACIYIKKYCFKWVSIDSFPLFNSYQLYKNIYWNTLSMEGPITHNQEI
jgi:hypothetical protein